MINENSHPAKTEAADAPVALLYCTDLMFSVRLQSIARATGYRFVNARPGTPLPNADVMVVDLNSRGDWESAVREAAGRGITVIGFGSHTEAEARRRAKAAGASRVLSNGNLTRDLPFILQSLRDGEQAAAANED